MSVLAAPAVPPAVAPAAARRSICIVAHAAFGAISGGVRGHVGGVERQTTLMARWLARRGHQVSLLVWNEGQGDEVLIDGVRVISICGPKEGLPVLRFLHPRWTGLARAMSRADAEVYYQNCGESVTGQVAHWCRRRARPFVYSVASDPECDPAAPMLPRRHERALFRYGLRHATRIIAQTRLQQRMLRAGSGLASIVLPMPCPGPGDGEYRAPEPPGGAGPARFVWVGRLSPEKRPELLLDVAAALPDVRFDVVGPAGDNGLSRRVADRARALPNVTLAGRIPREDMARVYDRATGLICTSAYEGFPNTFLEAWSYGVPVISTIDPDDLIREQGLGATARHGGEIVEAVKRLARSRDEWLTMSARARAYYSRSHQVDEALARFEQVFTEVR